MEVITYCLNNKILIEYFEDLSKYRRQEDTLSRDKLDGVIEAYRNYHKKEHIAEDHIVYLNQSEIERLND